MMPPIVTLTTDYGLKDNYVATLKGILLSRIEQVRIVDVSHLIRPQDIMEGAFVLQHTYPFFPKNSLHIAVIDPGVGSNRRAIAIYHNGHYFIGPDNGLFALILGTDTPEFAVNLDKPEFWLHPNPDATFHGRDIFTPVAAALLAGKSLQEVGTPITTIKPLRWVEPTVDKDGIQGWVVHVDTFGNCVTNIKRTHFEQFSVVKNLKCYAGASIVKEISTHYQQAPPGDVMALYGSHGFLEIAVNGGNAAHILGIDKHSPVDIYINKQVIKRAMFMGKED
jgi:S-adenosyl-L-methionine hydrolase (adenosine-forming)